MTEKIISNLTNCNYDCNEEKHIIINQSLNSLNSFIGNSSCCKLISNTSYINKIIYSNSTNLNIL